LCQDKSLNVVGTFTHLFKLLENAFVGESDLDELESGKKIGCDFFSLKQQFLY
jgi:hypothetical protein